MPSPQQPPHLDEALVQIGAERVAELVGLQARGSLGPAHNGRYRHWDKLRRLTPPHNLTLVEWWLGIKLSRLSSARRVPLKAVDGTSFSYVLTDEMLQYLRYVDQHFSGEIAIDEPMLRDQSRRSRLLVNSIIEEATRSSQLEGATTSRRAAKEMIRKGRHPSTRSERMIFNNYHAMEFIRAHKTSELSPELICELQGILTEGTLDNPDEVGRIQRPEDIRVGVYLDPDNELVHQPPPAEELPERLRALCDFANKTDDDTPYVHPVIRAITLHLWLAYDHPFADGNGRTARALFYWSMLRSGYWMTEFTSISKILYDGPTRYGKSFLYVETDSFDSTYFVLNQLRVLQRAFEELNEYLLRKAKEIKKSERSVNRDGRFNGRQLALLRHALRHPDYEYTASSHARSHRITTQSARNDLSTLTKSELLTMRTRGRQSVYSPAPDIAEKLN